MLAPGELPATMPGMLTEYHRLSTLCDSLAALVEYERGELPPAVIHGYRLQLQSFTVRRLRVSAAYRLATGRDIEEWTADPSLFDIPA